MSLSRLAKLENWVRNIGIDTLLVDDPLDLFYLTGLSFSVGRLAVFPDRACLLLDGRYLERAKKEAPCPVKPKEGLADLLHEQKKVGFDSAFLSYDGFRSMEKAFPGKEWIPFSKPLKELRAIKEASEIEALKRAANLTWAGFQHILSLLKEGVYEEELALEFEIFCRRRGASRLSFPSIVAFGENSAFPHYRAGKIRLQKDQIALFDLGAVVDGYPGDMTRVVFFGRPNPQLEQDYHLIKRVQKSVLDAIRPGLRFGELDRIARDELRKEGVASLFTHGLSHGVGLDVHEYPFLRIDGGDAEIRLQAGMVFTVEPGIYRPGLGGVRYEDTVAVTANGYENFFAPSP